MNNNMGSYARFLIRNGRLFINHSWTNSSCDLRGSCPFYAKEEAQKGFFSIPHLNKTRFLPSISVQALFIASNRITEVVYLHLFYCKKRTWTPLVVTSLNIQSVHTTFKKWPCKLNLIYIELYLDTTILSWLE